MDSDTEYSSQNSYLGNAYRTSSYPLPTSSRYISNTHLIDKLGYANSIQNNAKEFHLDFGGHSVRAIYANQPRMYWNVCILTVRTGFIGRASEICAVPSDEDPVVVQDDLL